MKYDFKRGQSKRQKCNDRHFVIIGFFRNLITFQRMFLKVVIYLDTFKHSKKYNRAEIKYLPVRHNIDIDIVYLAIGL